MNNQHEYWINKYCNIRGYFALECSHCHNTLYASNKYYDYCPFCSCKMDKSKISKTAQK